MGRQLAPDALGESDPVRTGLGVHPAERRDLTTLQFVGFSPSSRGAGLIFGYVTGQLVPTDPTFQNFSVIDRST